MVPFEVGTGNVISVVVTAEDGETTQTYTVTVTRAGSADAALSALSLSGMTLIAGLRVRYGGVHGVGGEHAVTETTVIGVGERRQCQRGGEGQRRCGPRRRCATCGWRLAT